MSIAKWISGWWQLSANVTAVSDQRSVAGGCEIPRSYLAFGGRSAFA